MCVCCITSGTWQGCPQLEAGLLAREESCDGPVALLGLPPLHQTLTLRLIHVVKPVQLGGSVEDLGVVHALSVRQRAQDYV